MKKPPILIETETPDFKVTLKPFWGIKPPVYVGVFFGIVILLILYFALLHEGIQKPGQMINLTTTPSGASIYLGEIRVGSSPISFFVPQGPFSLTVKKPGFKTQTSNFTADSSLFAAQWFRSVKSIPLKLEIVSFQELVDFYQKDLSVWALAGPFEKDYLPPPLFTMFVEDAQTSMVPIEDIKTQLKKWRNFVGDYYVYKDYCQAWGLWASNSNLPSFEDQWKIWLKALEFPEDQGAFLVYWIVANQEPRLREEIYNSAFFQEKIQSYTLTLNGVATGTMLGPVQYFGGQTFQPVPSGLFLWGAGKINTVGSPTPKVSVQSFWMGQTEVSRTQFSAFLLANPDLKLTENNILEGWKENLPPKGTEDFPVNFIPWRLAKEYGNWFTRTYLKGTGLKADIPNEIQWEWAAIESRPNNKGLNSNINPERNLKAVQNFIPNGLGIKGINENVMEWTSGVYSPFEPLVRITSVDWNQGPAQEMGVRGGNWGNPNKVGNSERAGQPGNWCTPFIGFRLVIEKE